MRRTALAVFLAPLLFISFSGCLITTRAMQNEQAIAQLKKQVATIETRQNQLEEKFQGVAEKSGEAYLHFDTMQAEMQTLRGKFDEAGFGTKKYNREVEGLRNFMGAQLSTVEERLGVLEKKAGVKKAKNLEKVPAAGAIIAGSSAGKNEKKKPEDLYKEAHSAFKSVNFEKAKAQFRLFVREFPKHKLADDAQFHLAECFFKQKDWENAILEFDKVTAKYPGSKLTRSAYLSLGFAFLELGSRSDARLFFEKVVADYPGTDEAKMAKKKLELLK